MAFRKTSDSIIIDAVLTEKGRKYLARGTFEVAKFAYGDDEIDYGLCTKDSAVDDTAAFKNMSILEAYTNKHKNIQYGLNSFDKGIVYLKDDELSDPSYNPEHPHAYLFYLPVLKLNTVLDITPTLRDAVYYISVNNETTDKIATLLPNFKFMESDDIEKRKFVVETGIDTAAADAPQGNLHDRERYIVEKFLLDQDFLIYADSRFTYRILGITKDSEFKNYSSAQSIINFETLSLNSPVSLENQFDNYATFLIKTVDNMISDFYSESSTLPSTNLSSVRGSRGVVSAFNIKVSPELKINSTGTRDFRYAQFGSTDQSVFGGTSKFDYIDTTIYVLGATTNSRIQIPIRLIRYAGT